ncbi:unnamed protein product, partial [Rotaria magnacalcarata]
TSNGNNIDVETLKSRIEEQANFVRNLKTDTHSSKEEVTAAIDQLLKLKEQYKTLTGADITP